MSAFTYSKSAAKLAGTAILASLCSLPAMAATPAAPAIAPTLSSDTEQAIDAIVTSQLRANDVPSASIAIVKDGKIVFAKAYGDARRASAVPAVAATPDMRYKIASNSKQLTAAAILLLAEQHKLSLDDHVSRFFPELERARDITIRELLTHTAGYQDYYAIDYLPIYMEKDTTPKDILSTWAKKPLNFEPGARWQYSNTGYVLLGQIIEKVSGQSLIEFLRKRIFSRLEIRSAIDVSSETWSDSDPAGYTRYAMGPLREAKPEGKGWMFAAGELAMTASDLARWDIALMNSSILKPTSTKSLTTEMLLTDGTGSKYAFGLDVSQTENGHRRWAHTGGASGFLSSNVTFPDDKIAITVLTNGEGAAFRSIESQIEKLLFSSIADTDAEASLARAKKLFISLQKGEPDRSTLTSDLDAYFSPNVLGDFATSLGPLGEPKSIAQTGRWDRGGMVQRRFIVRTASQTLRMDTYIRPDGRFEQCLISDETAK